MDNRITGDPDPQDRGRPGRVRSPASLRKETQDMHLVRPGTGNEDRRTIAQDRL